MKNKTRLFVVSLCVAGLSSCSSFYEEGGSAYSYGHGSSYPQGQYPEGRYVEGQADGGGQVKKPVEVPNSYHVGEYHSPTRHKNRDRNWVNSQNPMGYTIEVADDEKPSDVASKLQKAPANDRKAAVKYEKGGKTHYKGVYGTFNSYQEAKKALENLPEDVKAGAKVKNWGSVQGGVNR